MIQSTQCNIFVHSYLFIYFVIAAHAIALSTNNDSEIEEEMKLPKIGGDRGGRFFLKWENQKQREWMKNYVSNESVNWYGRAITTATTDYHMAYKSTMQFVMYKVNKTREEKKPAKNGCLIALLLIMNHFLFDRFYRNKR